MITYEPVHTIVTREAVILNGTKIGEVWPTEHGYQCQLSFGPLIRNYIRTSLNGSGSTKMEAYQAAIKNGRKDANALIDATAWLAGELVEEGEFIPLAETAEQVTG